MLYDLTANDACFREGRPPAGIDELLSWARSRLGDRPPWRLISARRKMGRTLFEIEEDTPSGPRRLIGKIGKSERAGTLYRTLQALRRAGFAPPARYTVPEPVAFIDERGFVLQEKVAGTQAAVLLSSGGDAGCAAARDCAAWLAALHECRLPAAASEIDAHDVWTWANDLASACPSAAGRIRAVADAIFSEIGQKATDPLPSHGDFHPMNVFISGAERVTGIDIDKFALREPESDAGWFLMQTAAFGFFENGSFNCTAAARRAFVERYEAESGRALRLDRALVYIAMAFLKNLHFELVLLKTGRTEYTDPWLSAASSAILDGRLHFDR